jgi:type VI secretion system protein ImpF
MASRPRPRAARTPWSTQDRLQAPLLDRLLDHEPQRHFDERASRVQNRAQLRAAVLRDLSWLFSTLRPEPAADSVRKDDLAPWRDAGHARRSVLNFGLPVFAGITRSGLDRRAIERTVIQAIEVFEPRIDPSTLGVEVRVDLHDHHNTLQLVIRGQLWSHPVPLALLLAADLDLETGAARLRELRA